MTDADFIIQHDVPLPPPSRGFRRAPGQFAELVARLAEAPVGASCFVAAEPKENEADRAAQKRLITRLTHAAMREGDGWYTVRGVTEHADHGARIWKVKAPPTEAERVAQLAAKAARKAAKQAAISSPPIAGGDADDGDDEADEADAPQPRPRDPIYAPPSARRG